MCLQYVPLLQTQRQLQGLPRNRDRFQEYLRTLSADGETVDLPPLGVMNPMGKDHVTELLDALLALDADGFARRTLAECTVQPETDSGSLKLALVVVDDLKGGWTNRFDYEFKLRYGPGAQPAWIAGPRPKWLKDDWLTAVLWSSEPASELAIRESLFTSIHRAAYVQKNGFAQTLPQLMIQEGCVMRSAGCTGPVLEADDLAYTRKVIAPFSMQMTSGRVSNVSSATMRAGRWGSLRAGSAPGQGLLWPFTMRSML